MGKYDKTFVKYEINTPKIDIMRPPAAPLPGGFLKGDYFLLKDLQ